MPIKITVGDKAPNFALPDTDLKIRSLKEFRGHKVVIAFYVVAFTSVCTKEMCAFRDATDRLVDLKAQIIGKSSNDPFSNKEFKEKNKLPFPILSDYNHRTIRAYGIESHNFAELKGYTVAKRSIFIVDKNGIVRYIWSTDMPTREPNYDEIEKTLEKIE